MRAKEFANQGAAGIVLYAQDTGRYGLQQRSDTINDPGLWAAWGGGREPGESLEQCARRELGEESGYTGPIKLKRIGENSKYVTFLGIIPHEFSPVPCDEWKDYCWVEAGNWPGPLHPGTAAALKNVNLNEDEDYEDYDGPYDGHNFYGGQIGEESKLNNNMKAKDITSKSTELDEYIDPELAPVLSYAAAHYPNYKKKPEAFMKWSSRAIKHSLDKDTEHDQEIANINTELEDLKQSLEKLTKLTTRK